MFKTIDKYPQFTVVEENDTIVKIAPVNKTARYYAEIIKASKQEKVATNGKIIKFM